MDKLNNTLFDAQLHESPAGLACALARLAMPGHFDELRGRATASAGGVVGVTLKGQGSGFFMEIATRSGQDAFLVKARSTELHVYTAQDGGEQHCHLDNVGTALGHMTDRVAALLGCSSSSS